MKIGNRLLPWLLVACLTACAGAEFTQNGSVTGTEVGTHDGAPVGTGALAAATDTGTLGSQSASQDVTQNFAYDLRFADEVLETSSDVGGLIYEIKYNQKALPPGKLDKVIRYPEFSHAPCCMGQAVRVIDFGLLPPVAGENPDDEVYLTFTQLSHGDYDWGKVGGARYRDYVIGSPDSLGQNLPWDDLPAQDGQWYSFLLLPEGTEVVEQWTGLESEEVYIQIARNRDFIHLRDLRLRANGSRVPLEVPKI